MARERDPNIAKLRTRLGTLRDVFQKLPPALFVEVGNYIAARIVFKARTGKTMVDGTEKPLKPLDKEYIEFRESIMSGVKTGAARARQRRRENSFQSTKGIIKDVKGKVVDPKYFSPARSNLTLTGQYLASIKLKSVNVAERLLTIAPSGMRKRGPQFIKVKNAPLISNEKLASYLEKQGRSIFGIDKTTKSVISKKVINEIRKGLRKNLLRK